MRQNCFGKSAIAGLALVALSACDAPQIVNTNVGAPNVPATSSPEVDRFAQQFLNSIQLQSIGDSREYCGYFVVNNGELLATTPRKGTEASCNYGPIPNNTVASYHTHGSYGAAFDNEVPSGFDLTSALDVGIDDYVSTPGGRLWRVEGENGNAVQLCGLGCLAQDPGFVPRNEDEVLQSYTIATMRIRQEG